ncbi:hypothetical protein N7447_006003 [Penicillium robsamsonii]|uniref:uncharacterized protein n=1 Tax=Penicillium robsamsonii TaxID=1792511 RepID=UPI002546AABD|nr:uncharacterized protein N7447_006003 [Penicillium robsamsonii]KAJ5823663.1 hypothetical protein N7447_006003 [Penicillium robsamsonii]
MAYADVLPSTTPKYEFKGIQHCLQIVEGPDDQDEQYEGYMDSRNPYVIFTIDERSFLDCFVNSEERSLGKSWECYDPSINELLVKIMESGPHAVGTTAFTRLFDGWLGPDDPNYPLVGTAAMLYRGSSNKKKRADCSWKPGHSGLDRGWPTIVVEVAYSETTAKMMRDVKFWLNECSGHVNIVLTVNIHERRRISIEQWKMGNRTAFPVQKLEIARNPAPNCEKIQGRMRFSFEDIHLRPKGPDDIDFIISHRDIENLAHQVWHQQDKEDKQRTSG